MLNAMRLASSLRCPRPPAIRCILLVMAVAGLLSGVDGSRPLFSFGLVADIQYADKDTDGARRYREALGKLQAAVASWNIQEPAFVADLGDQADGRGAQTGQDLRSVMDVLRTLKAPLRSVIGNHPLGPMTHDQLQEALGLKRAWYDFVLHGWRFVVLDAMDLSFLGWPKDSPQRSRAQAWFDARSGSKRPELKTYNGGIGDEQKAWLQETLARAAAADERVVILCHIPTVREASTQAHILWNHEEIAAMVESCPAVVAFIAGHEHGGGYTCRNGIHHITCEALVQAAADGNAYGTVHVHPDRLVIEGQGSLTRRDLAIRRSPAGKADASTPPAPNPPPTH